MAIYIANDLHGNLGLVQKTVDTIRKHMNKSDILIINGDGTGARGPIMNNLVKTFYEVRRGETDLEVLNMAIANIIGERPEFPKSWVFESVHVGVFRAIMSKKYSKFKKSVENELFDVIKWTLRPLSEAAREVGAKIIYLPGNGEIIPSDFDTEDITVEKALPPEKRFYQIIARKGYFNKFNITYVPYAYMLTEQVNPDATSKTLLISTNLLDLPTEEALKKLNDYCPLDGKKRPRNIVVHYPSTISPIGKWFDFWTPNRVDIARIDALEKLVEALELKDATLFFGHIHLSADSRMDKLPPTIGFGYERPDYNSIWVKPGEVVRIK